MRILTVNLGQARPSTAKDVGITGIDKQPTDGPVLLRVPDAKGVSGVGGDFIGDTAHHGGADQAVYAYAREDLDGWAAELGRSLRSGMFGENLTTSGVDVNGALIGERWRIGNDVVLEAAVPRIPCGTFAAQMAEQGWTKRFTRRALPGAYLRVIEPGSVQAGDPVEVIFRPDHDVTIGTVFRALTLEPELLPRLVPIEALPQWLRDKAARRTA